MRRSSELEGFDVEGALTVVRYCGRDELKPASAARQSYPSSLEVGQS